MAILETAAEFVQKVPTSIYVPLGTYVAMAVFYIFWLVVALYLYSSGTQIIDSSRMIPFGQIDMSGTARSLVWVHLFGLFWGTAFL